MFGSQILEVTIGVIFLFLLISIVCSSIREAIEAWMKTRAAFLEHAIRELLHDKKAEGLVKSFYNHPLITALYSYPYNPENLTKSPHAWSDGAHLPSYIPASNFALALMDITVRGPVLDEAGISSASPQINIEAIRKNIANLKNSAVQRVVIIAIDTADGDIFKAQKNIEAWYNSGMDRVSGRYKRSTHWVIFWIGLIAAVSLNINTITFADYLYHNDAVRAVVVERAEQASRNPAFSKEIHSVIQVSPEIFRLPIGWSKGWSSTGPDVKQNTFEWWWKNVLERIFGWLITALAATIGAPFWFDILNKVMVIRSTVKPQEKSPEENSEDRQFPGNNPSRK